MVFVWYFLTIKLGFKKSTTAVKFPSHHIITWVPDVHMNYWTTSVLSGDLKLNHLVKVAFAKFLHSQVFFPLYFLSVKT